MKLDLFVCNMVCILCMCFTFVVTGDEKHALMQFFIAESICTVLYPIILVRSS